jgi:thiol-disulfide isomerase/thioredoxin
MKSAIKYFTFFVILSIVLSAFVGCQKSTENSSSSFPKGDYPAAPPAIMQAELTKTDGTAFKLEDYKGKVVLVNLWATWCGPCKAEMPELVKIQDEHKDKGFEIVGLNIDEGEDAAMIKSFGEKMGLNYQLAKGEYKLGGDFLKISKVDAIPQSFLIDRDGRLVGVFVGGGKSAVDKIKTNVARVVAG